MNAENGVLRKNFELYREWRKQRGGDKTVFDREMAVRSLTESDRARLEMEYQSLLKNRDAILRDLDAKLIPDLLMHYAEIYRRHLQTVTHDKFNFGDGISPSESLSIDSKLPPNIQNAVGILSAYAAAGGDVRKLVLGDDRGAKSVDQKAAANIEMVLDYSPLEKTLYDPPIHWFQRKNAPPMPAIPTSDA